MASTGKYFMVEFVPKILASEQHLGPYALGDVLWYMDSVNYIQIPSGPARLIGATALIRPQGDSRPTPNNFGLDLIFSTEMRRESLAGGGTIPSNSVAFSGSPSNDVIGSVRLPAGDHVASALSACTSIVSTGDKPGNIVLNRGPGVMTEPLHKKNGYDTYYVGGIANGAFDFTSRIQVNETGFSAGTQTAITLNGISKELTQSVAVDARELFLAGDYLVAQDDADLGYISTVDSATQVTLTTANIDAIADDDYIYTLNPIRIKLFFER